MAEIDRLLTDLITQRAPGLFKLHGVGTDTAASLLVAAGDNPNRLHSEGVGSSLWDHPAPRQLRQGNHPLSAQPGVVTATPTPPSTA